MLFGAVCRGALCLRVCLMSVKTSLVLHGGFGLAPILKAWSVRSEARGGAASLESRAALPLYWAPWFRVVQRGTPPNSNVEVVWPPPRRQLSSVCVVPSGAGSLGAPPPSATPPSPPALATAPAGVPAAPRSLLTAALARGPGQGSAIARARAESAGAQPPRWLTVWIVIVMGRVVAVRAARRVPMWV